MILLAVLALATVAPPPTGANAQTAGLYKIGIGQFGRSLGAKYEIVFVMATILG